MAHHCTRDFWHCLDCGTHERVSLPPDLLWATYKLGDHAKCPRCSYGEAYVVTSKQAVCYERGLELGLEKGAAWSRALRLFPNK
jgi:hypothetical protein